MRIFNPFVSPWCVQVKGVWLPSVLPVPRGLRSSTGGRLPGDTKDLPKNFTCRPWTGRELQALFACTYCTRCGDAELVWNWQSFTLRGDHTGALLLMLKGNSIFNPLCVTAVCVCRLMVFGFPPCCKCLEIPARLHFVSSGRLLQGAGSFGCWQHGGRQTLFTCTHCDDIELVENPAAFPFKAVITQELCYSADRKCVSVL